jgi:hypothetical protein
VDGHQPKLDRARVLEAMGHGSPRDRDMALVYDDLFLTPTLAMNGGAGFGFMRTTAKALAETIPNARYLELPGQRHDVDAKVLAPVLADFFCVSPALSR